MKKIFVLALMMFFIASKNNAQTVTIYRGGIAISPIYSTVKAASVAALNGDSIVLSAHKFKEYNILLPMGTIWKGTQTLKDSSIIDADHKGPCISGSSIGSIKRNIIVRDIIVENGEGKGGGVGSSPGPDTLKLKGYSIVRNCHSENYGGAAVYAFLYDHAKLMHNTADSFGGGACFVWAYDSSEICYNSSRYGGAIGYLGGSGKFYCNSPGVRIHHNTATLGGGALACNVVEMTAGQITDNQAPIGAAFWTYPSAAFFNLTNCYIYNPTPAGKRQNEIYAGAIVNINGSWFGKSDTVGLTQLTYSPFLTSAIVGKYAKANWSVNKGKPITNKDTLFPIGAGFTYSDGTALPPNALPWLQGKFSASTGKMLTPIPTVKKDTMQSLFRTYVYATKVDTTSKPINFVCIVDADTFRTSPRVWGIDSIKLSIGPKTLTTVVRVYPNPTSDYIHIEGLETGTSIELYDLSGRLVKNEKLINGFGATLVSSTYAQPDKAVLDVQSLPAGLYTLKITSKEGAVGTAKVMKE